MNLTDNQKPKYEIITDDLLARIKNNDFSYDTVFCTEKQISEQYHVSRITAKRALTDLEARGVLYRKRGVGSFVARNALNNLSAPAPSPSESKMVSFLIPFDVTKGNMFDVIKTVNDQLNANGYLMSIYISDISSVKETANIRLLLTQNISGLIYYPMRDKINLNLLNNFVFAHIPVVLIDKTADCPYIHNVTSDNYEGGRLLAEYLIGIGHRRIGFLTTAPIEETSTVRKRFGGYFQQMSLSGITIHQSDYVCVPYEVTEDDIFSEHSLFCDAIKHLYANGVTALLTENDRVAQLAILACRRMNIRVPEDLSICGFDDSDIAKEHNITSIKQNFQTIGEEVSRILLTAMSSPAAPIQNVSVPVELVVRGSTGTPPKD